MKSITKTSKILFGGLYGLLLTFGFVSTAPAVDLDGFVATINPLPSSVNSSGLTPNSLYLEGNYPGYYSIPAENTPIDPGLGGYYFNEGWEKGTAPARTNPWGATNPFENTALDGGEYDALYDGIATYNYSTPKTALTILWGTLSADNYLGFYDKNGVQIGNFIDGGSETDSLMYDVPGYAQPESVDVTIQVPEGFYTVKILSETTSFEYSNLVATPLDAPLEAPEPSTWAMMLGGLGALAFWRLRSRRALI